MHATVLATVYIVAPQIWPNQQETLHRSGVTSEYPAGTYHYYITDDYPYIPRCVFGTTDGTFRVRR